MTALATEIISRTKRLITMPTDDTLFTSTDYVAFINEVLLEKIFPKLMKIRDDYCTIRQVFPLQDSNNNDLYTLGVMPIPNRAWGNTLREIKYIDVSGNYYKINPYFLGDLDLYQTKNLAFSSTYQRGFIPMGPGIQLIPPPLDDPGSIEMYFVVQPATVIYDNISNANPAIPTGYASVKNMVFNQNTNITVYTVEPISPNGYFDSYMPQGQSRLVDIYDLKSGQCLYIDILLNRQSATQLVGTSIEQDGTDILYPDITAITNFQNGGYPVNTDIYAEQILLMPAGQTSYTPIPNVLDKWLCYELAIKLLSAQGYVEELQLFKQESDELRKDLLAQMAMRVDTEPHVIKNTRGLRRAIMYGGGSRRYNR